MRKIIAVVLTTLLLSACGTNQALPFPPEPTFQDASGYVVDGIMTYPNYTFSDTPSTEEIRQTAVRAFRDLLSVRWSTISPISYRKAGPVSEKTFVHEPDVTYAGTLYSNANVGLFQFLEYYDFNTGRLNYPGDNKDLKQELGAACADAMLWSVSTVCNSINGAYYPVTMVYQNGYLPVGDYTYDYSIKSFNEEQTYRIVENNGAAVMLDAYSRMLPADMLVSSAPANHGMMAIEAPTVVRNCDGTIDPEISYILVQDQRAGTGDRFYEILEDAQIIRYSGRTNAQITFAELLEKCYIPVTTAEFIGQKTYEKASVSLNQECRTANDLSGACIKSNYPLAVLNVVMFDAAGTRHLLERKLFSGERQPGVPREFTLNQLEILSDFSNSPYNISGCTLEIEVVPATGERIVVVSIPL